MPPQMATVVKAFGRHIDIRAEPLPARAWLESVCKEEGWFDDEPTMSEWCEAKADRFLDQLRSSASTLIGMGRYTAYDFNSSSSYMVQGWSYVEPLDPPDVVDAKEKRARMATYGDILKQVTPEQFESLCAGLLAELGVSDPTVTPRSNDQGLDFYGHRHLASAIQPQNPFPTVEKQLSVWIVGQAKRYEATQAATPDIRELVGSIELAKSRVFTGANEKYKDLKIRLCDPVWYMFVTTGDISRDGWQLIERSGVIGMDGEMLATFLADQAIGVDHEGHLDTDKFWGWLESLPSP